MPSNSEAEYYYKYDPEAPSRVNNDQSFRLDGLRAKLSPTTEQARARVLAAEAEKTGPRNPGS